MKQDWRVLKAGTLAAAVVSGLLMACSMAISALLARMLPQEHLGGYYLLVQGVILLALVAMLGTNNALQGLLAVPASRGDWASVRVVLLRALVLVGCTFVAVAVILRLGWQPVMEGVIREPALAPLAGLATLLVVTQIVDELVSVFFRATGRTRIGLALLNLPRQAIFLLVIATLWWGAWDVDLEWVVELRLLVTLATAAVGVALVAFALRHARGPAAQDAPTVAKLARTSSPMMVHNLSAALRHGMDFWFLGIFANSADVGVYGAMVQASGLLAMMLSVVNMVIPPMLASMYAESRLADMETLMRRASTLTAWGVGVLLIVFVAFGHQLIELLFGPAFERGYATLVLLSIAQAVAVSAGSPGWLLQMTGHQDMLMRITIASVAVKLLLTWWGAAAFGLEGVAASTCAMTIVQNAVTAWAAHRQVGLRTSAYLNPLRALGG